MERMEVVEELTDQVEVVFHESTEEFDPLSIGDEEMMELEEAAKLSLSLAQSAEEEALAAGAEDSSLPSTSNAAYKASPSPIEHVFRVPVGPALRARPKPIRLDHLRMAAKKIPLSVEGFSILEYEARAAAEKAAAEEEEERQKIAAEEAEWEDTLIYVDLDDIPSVEELFAVEPDDFLAVQSKKMRERQKQPKPCHSVLKLKFYNLDATNPILQIGRRFYTGKYEEAVGSGLFFREKGAPEPNPMPSTSGDPQPRRPGLRKLTTDMIPPPDPVFGTHLKVEKEYELVANVHKVLKMTRRNVIPKLQPKTTEDGEPIPQAEPPVKRPIFPLPEGGLSYDEALAYKYTPKWTLKDEELFEAPPRRPKAPPKDPLAETSESEDSESELEEDEDDDVDEDDDEVDETTPQEESTRAVKVEME